MKKIITPFMLCITLFMLASISTFAATAYVKVIACDNTVSWTKITGSISGTNFTIGNGSQRAISSDVEGTINLNEVWSNEDGTGNHYIIVAMKNFVFSGCNSLTHVILPDNITTISQSAFKGCSNLESVVLPAKLSTIGNSAFYNCQKLKDINIPESVTAIGQNAFYSCKALTSINIPCGTIGSSAFKDCNNLKDVTLGNGVTSIGSEAFRRCTSLIEIDIPNGIETISKYTFSGCNNLTKVIIPNSVTTIGQQAFGYCSGLTSIHIQNGTIGSSAFIECNNLKDVTLGNGVTSIGSSAFKKCSSLTEIMIPQSIAEINDYTFSSCTKLTIVTIPNSVKTIGQQAFQFCSSLKSITFPNSITKIDNWAFEACDSLTSVISNIENPFTISESVFKRVHPTANPNLIYNQARLYYPEGTEDKYIITSSWNQFWNIKDIPVLVLNVSEAGMATLYKEYALKIPENENIKGVYYGKNIENDELILSPIEGVIPAKTGALVYAEPGTYVFHRSEDEGTVIAENLLQGTIDKTKTSAIEGTVLTLGHGKESGEVGFYKYTGTWLAANKAYIVLPSTTEIKNLGIALDEHSTNIQLVDNKKKETTTIYDMMGRRFSANVSLPKGLYIIDSKKVFIR